MIKVEMLHMCSSQYRGALREKYGTIELCHNTKFGYFQNTHFMNEIASKQKQTFFLSE